MANMFTMDDKDFKKFLKFIGKFNRGLPRATGTYLNNLAFEARTQSINTLSETMFVKAPGFIPRRLVVEKNKNFYSIRGQESTVGSASLPRFGGWLEQQTGQSEGRERNFTIQARRNNKSRPAVRPARLRAGKTRKTPNDYKGPTRHVRAMVMMRTLKKEKYNKPFIMFGHNNMKSGLYKLVRRVPRMLQKFGTPRKTKRIQWMDKAIKKTLSPRTTQAAWSRTMTHLMTFR